MCAITTRQLEMNMSDVYNVNIGPVSLTIGPQFVRFGLMTLHLTNAEHVIFCAIATSPYPGINLTDLYVRMGMRETPKALAILRTNVSSIRKKIKLFEKFRVTTHTNHNKVSYRLEGVDKTEKAKNGH